MNNAIGKCSIIALVLLVLFCLLFFRTTGS